MLVSSIVRSVGVATVLGGTVPSPSLPVNPCVRATRLRPVEDIMLRESSAQGYLVGCPLLCQEMNRLVGKPTMWFPNRSDTNRPVQAQKRARSLKFQI